MIDTPSVFSLVRYSGQELMQFSTNLHGEEGLQYAIFTFVPSCETLYHSMSSTVSLETIPWNVWPRSRFCPAVEDRPKIRRGRRNKTNYIFINKINLNCIMFPYVTTLHFVIHSHGQRSTIFNQSFHFLLSGEFTFITFRFQTLDIIFSPISFFPRFSWSSNQPLIIEVKN